MPDENPPAARERMGSAAARWLAAHAGGEGTIDVSVRFDAIGMIVLSENKALLRHRINCLGADFAGQRKRWAPRLRLGRPGHAKAVPAAGLGPPVGCRCKRRKLKKRRCA